MKTACIAFMVGAVAAIGCGGSSAHPDGGSGTAGSSGGGSTGAAGSGSGGSTGTAGSGPGSCGNVEPCGGSIVGNWNLTGECINWMALAPQTQALCAQATLTNVSVSLSGSVAFNADSSYTLAETGTAVITWNVPSSCLAGATCDYFAGMFQSQLPAGATFTCTGSSNCSCTEAALVTTNDNGTYGTTGSSLVITSAVTGQTSTGGYCVQGTTLHLVTIDATMHTGPMGQATINKDVTAEKR